MSDCSNHKKEIEGISDTKVLAEAIDWASKIMDAKDARIAELEAEIKKWKN